MKILSEKSIHDSAEKKFAVYECKTMNKDRDLQTG